MGVTDCEANTVLSIIFVNATETSMISKIIKGMTIFRQWRMHEKQIGCQLKNVSNRSKALPPSS